MHTNPTAGSVACLRIGVVLPEADPTIPPDDGWNDSVYFAPLLQGIKDSCHGLNVELVLTKSHYSGYRLFYHARNLDGLIIAAPSRSAVPVLQQLTDDRIRHVAVGLSLHTPEDEVLPSVDTDNRLGAADVARHLLELGHRDIAIVNLATDHTNQSDRQQGCQEIFCAAGWPIKPENLVLHREHIIGRFDERIEVWLMQALSKLRVPTAIFACDYTMAVSVLRILGKHKLRVPEDVSLVSFDDPLSAAHITPPLTTVRQPVYQLGRRAALRLLCAVLDGSTQVANGTEMLPTELIVRMSTAAPRARARTGRSGIETRLIEPRNLPAASFRKMRCEL